MAEIFSNFTTTLVIIGAILAIGIIFEEQFLALEDKFDAYIASLKAQRKAAPVQAQNKKKAAPKIAEVTFSADIHCNSCKDKG